jgi:hypothetical protein
MQLHEIIQTPTTNPSVSKDIERIIAFPIRGNAYADQKLMDLIHKYVINPKNHMNNKILALKKLDAVMGVDAKEITPADVEQYIKYGDEYEENYTSRD